MYVVVVGVDVAGGLVNEKRADDGDKEHQVAGECEEDAHAVATETLVGAAAAVGAIVPVVVFASAAGALVSWRTAAGAVVVVFESTLSFLVGFVWSDGGRHRGALSKHALWTSLLRFCVCGVFDGWLDDGVLDPLR